MKINSLARRTDLIFARCSGEVTDKGSFTLIQTPSNPNYHWGNYIIFDNAPQAGDFPKWSQIFKEEFTYYDQITHMVFTWDTLPPKKGDYSEFTKNDFEFEEGVVLSTNQVNRPPKHNNNLEIRKIKTDLEWEEVIELQILCSDLKYINEEHDNFKRRQMAQYRAMSENKMGHWYGAYIGGLMVADLGLYYENDLGRYQSVGTHPEYRRQGICQTLVYETAKLAFSEYKVTTLVMEADTNYHAAKIYESVGFKPGEKNYSLSWWVHN
jgi:ribosomal protein S18 acetylase RimI-like enzyme